MRQFCIKHMVRRVMEQQLSQRQHLPSSTQYHGCVCVRAHALAQQVGGVTVEELSKRIEDLQRLH